MSGTKIQTISAEEDLFKILVENVLDVITLLGVSGEILYQSPSIERVFGYGQEELIGQNVVSFIHPDHVEEVSARLTELFERKSDEERLELRFLHKNGEWRYIEVLARIFESASISRVIVNSRDVTENHRVRVELNQSIELFETAFHANSNICSLSKFDNGEFIDVNTAWEKATGWTREEAVSSTALQLNIWGSLENRERVVSGLRNDGFLKQLPVTIKSRAGLQVDLMIDAKILMISGNRCLYLCAADVTSQKKLEEQLRHSQKMEAIGQLTGGVAHDFNNLLSVILGNCELIKSKLAHDDGSQEDLDAIAKSITRGKELTQQLLAFSRKQTLLPVSIELDKEIEKTVSMLNRSLGEAIEIRTKSDEHLWPCLADQGQLENAVLNLALNARDAMPKGGVLEIFYANKSVGVREQAQLELAIGDYVCITVSDNGEGIEPELLPLVFEPFFSTKDIGKGTGLGLSMVFGFAKQSGGHVLIESELYKGTSITLFLPRCKDQ